MTKPRIKLLRDHISRLCSSPYGSTAAVLDAICGRSRRLLHDFFAPGQSS